VTAVVTLSALGDAVAKTRAGDRALDTFCPARTVATPRTRGQIERAGPGHGQVGARFALSWDAVGIAEATGLHLLHGSIDGRGGGGAEFASVDDLRRARSAGYLLKH